MPILREDDPRIAWLAVPLGAVAGFVVAVLALAAMGVRARVATFGGLVGMVVAAVAVMIFLRSRS